ncbi:MAG TPA: MXAN_5187 C-terminal domain-containing protein [Anaeromyxobacteraceae bacterium]|nr:MXAN_5187 C-terminal domain-containing protein [Anaeromyxobacteraceae bacterium]
MNRLKVSLYAVLVLVVVGLAAFQGSRWLAARALAQIDQDLKAAAAQADARAQLVAAEAAQISGALARDAAVVQALSSGSAADGLSAARPAVAAAEASEPEREKPLLLATSLRGDTRSMAGGSSVELDKQGAELVQAAASEAARKEGHALSGETLYYLVAVPVGRMASLAVGVPIGPGWLSKMRAASGADVTIVTSESPRRSTLPVNQALLVAKAAGLAAGKIADAGRLDWVASPQGAPWGELPLLAIRAPAYRVTAVALKGLPKGLLVLSEPTEAALEPVVTTEWLFVLVLVGLALAGFLTFLFVVNEQKTVVSRQLLATADRIARGDFSARVDVLAGSLGSIAAALNRAAEAAEQKGVSPGPVPGEEGGDGQGIGLAPAPSFDASARPAEEVDLRPREPMQEPEEASPPAEPEPPPSAAPRASVPDSDLATGAWANAFREPEPIAPRETPAPPPESTPTQPWSPNASPLPEGELPSPSGEASEPAAPAVVPAPAPEAPSLSEIDTADEEHWRLVYDEFITARKQSGEPVEGVTYERFRRKLKENRDQLVAKYACRTARFQVYLKQGRAALKASPVR